MNEEIVQKEYEGNPEQTTAPHAELTPAQMVCPVVGIGASAGMLWTLRGFSCWEQRKASTHSHGSFAGSSRSKTFLSKKSPGNAFAGPCRARRRSERAFP